jgi:hypothetical protein
VICWSEGEGWVLHANFTALRYWRVDGDGTRCAVALIGQRPADNPEGERRYYWCNFLPSTPLEVMVEYTHRPRRVGQHREEAKFEILPTSSPLVFFPNCLPSRLKQKPRRYLNVATELSRRRKPRRIAAQRRCVAR